MANPRKTLGTIMVLLLLLLLALLFGLWYYNNKCLTETNMYKRVSAASVLGVTSYTVIPDKTTVDGGDTAKFVIRNNLDSALDGGVLTLSLTGNGKIVAPIVGPGTCTITSDTQAVCTDLNLDPSKENVWEVSVLSDENCVAQSSIKLDTVLNAPLNVQIGEEDASISCTPKQAGDTTGDATAGGTSNGGTGGTSSDGGSILDEDSDIKLTSDESKLAKQVLDRHNEQLAQCLTNNTLFVGGLSLLLYLLFWLAVFFLVLSGRNNTVNVVKETTVM